MGIAGQLGLAQLGEAQLGGFNAIAPTPPTPVDYIPPRVTYRIIVEGELLNA